MVRPADAILTENGTSVHVAAAPPLRRTPSFVLWLAIVALVAQALDLISALRMIKTHGLAYELNPLARAIVALGGITGLTAIKLGAVVGAVLLFVWVGRYGRARLAASALVLASVVGVFGYYSNQV